MLFVRVYSIFMAD